MASESDSDSSLLEDVEDLEDMKALVEVVSLASKQAVPIVIHARQRFQSDPGRGLRTVDSVLTSGRPARVVNYMRMSLESFNLLCDELGEHVPHTHRFPLREKLALYLQYTGQGVTERKLEEDFQRPRSKFKSIVLRGRCAERV